MDSVHPQNFNLPIPIISYIIMNPSNPRLCLFLQKCCKIFLIKNPIVINHYLCHNTTPTDFEWELDDDAWISTMTPVNLTRYCKIWPICAIKIQGAPLFSSLLCKQLFTPVINFRSEANLQVHELYLRETTIIFDLLKIFAKHSKKISVSGDVTILDSSGMILEDILQQSENLRSFFW